MTGLEHFFAVWRWITCVGVAGCAVLLLMLWVLGRQYLQILHDCRDRLDELARELHASNRPASSKRAPSPPPLR